MNPVNTSDTNRNKKSLGEVSRPENNANYPNFNYISLKRRRTRVRRRETQTPPLSEVCEYGCSTGGSSILPLRSIQDAATGRSLRVSMNDLPMNDWSILNRISPERLFLCDVPRFLSRFLCRLPRSPFEARSPLIRERPEKKSIKKHNKIPRAAPPSR